MSAVPKRLLDLAIAVPSTILLAPLLAVIAGAIRIESRGGAIFRQERMGQFGRHFMMYKFRTMVDGAESMGTGLFSYEDDPRVTRVGRVLRTTSLDELPQLFNVINGTMSIVGPRPPVSYELGAFADFSPRLKSRFVVKPGVTGLAQVSGRNGLDWDGKLELDLEYIRCFDRLGIMYDIFLIGRTLVAVILMRNIIEERR